MNYGVDVWVPIIGMVSVLFWGLRLVSSVLLSSQRSKENATLMAGALSEKTSDASLTSFSRVAGAIGAVSMASFMAGLGLWIFFALGADEIRWIDRLQALSTYFLGGAALFAPYAFNQLSRIFKTP